MRDRRRDARIVEMPQRFQRRRLDRDGLAGADLEQQQVADAGIGVGADAQQPQRGNPPGLDQAVVLDGRRRRRIAVRAMQTLAQSIKQGERRLRLGLEHFHVAKDLGDFRRQAFDADHGDQTVDPLQADGVIPHARIVAQREEQVSRAVGQRAEDRRLDPEVVRVAHQEGFQHQGAVWPVKFSHRERELVAHAQGRVRGHQPELAPDEIGKRAPLGQLLGEQHRVLPHTPIGVPQAGRHVEQIQRTQTVERVQGVRASERAAGAGDEV